MIESLYRTRAPACPVTYHDEILIRTRGALEFEDVTDAVALIVRRAAVRDGLVNIQTRHTTTAIVVNENEPLLLDDLRDALERIAPSQIAYRHDDMRRRTVNLTPDERRNGHSHCKALFLSAGQVVNVVAGRMDLGRWQRVFLLELDHARPRTLTVMVFGVSAAVV